MRKRVDMAAGDGAKEKNKIFMFDGSFCNTDPKITYGYSSQIYLYEKDRKQYVVKVPRDKSHLKTYQSELDFFRKYNPDHKNIIKFMGICTDHCNVSGLVFPLLESDLCDFVYNQPEPTLRSFSWFYQSVAMGIKILSGLEYLHDTLKVVHRDIKPDNILVSDNGDVKITDFGLCIYDDQEHYSGGTPHYYAPDIVRAYLDNEKLPFSFCTDIWAFAITMLYCFSSHQVPYMLEKNGSPRSLRRDKEQGCEAIYMDMISFLEKMVEADFAEEYSLFPVAAGFLIDVFIGCYDRQGIKKERYPSATRLIKELGLLAAPKKVSDEHTVEGCEGLPKRMRMDLSSK